MLDLYRTAIGLMQDKLPRHHPHSWRFQANIHGCPWNEPIDEIFNPAPGEDAAVVRAHRALALGSEAGDSTASRLWGTCPHGTPHFLSWHRLYLAYFEQIIESVVQKPFALPYWGYIDESHRGLPEGFRDVRIAGAPNKLYFPARSTEFLDKGLKDIPGLQPDRYAEIFSNPNMFGNPRRLGFSEELEGSIHNRIHVAVGTSQGMGHPMFAARDPIFWLHHAAIDMLWESWRRPGIGGASAQDPAATHAWYQQRYALVDASANRNANNGAMFVLRAAENLTFRYDKLVDFPEILIGAGPAVAEGPPTKVQEGATVGNRITGSGDSITIRLKPSAPESVALGFSRNPSTRYILLLTLRTRSYPGLYRIYTTVKGTEVLVGAFDLFGAGSSHHGSHPPALELIRREIDITTKVRDKTIDPLQPGQFVIRAGNLDEPVDIRLEASEIEAR
jgi:tyrosinase